MFRGRITVKKRKRSMPSTNMDNHWCSFFLLKSTERREGTEGRLQCRVTALGQVGICKIFGVGYYILIYLNNGLLSWKGGSFTVFL